MKQYMGDKGVERQYFEAKPNKLWPELTRRCVMFARYRESVPCALCGKLSKRHWTCVVRFRAANLDDHPFIVQVRKNYFAAGNPVCEDHPLQPDENEFLRKVRAAMKKQKNNKRKEKV